MDAATNQEVWEVEANNEVFSTSFAEMAAWITQGSLLRIDRVRKGNLRWIEAGKVPSLVDFFNAKDAAEPPPPVISTTTTEILGVAQQPQQFVNPQIAVAAPTSVADACSMHPDAPAVYICDTCGNSFCKACPNSYGGTVKICPFCGAMCKSLAQREANNGRKQVIQASINEGFGFGDFAKSIVYPFKFKASLVMGALMFMFFSIGQSVVGFGGIFMMFSALICFLLANTLTFGILANTVENFSQGKLRENFMPSFDEFSLWDDVVHPFFLMIGVYISSFGPFIVVVLIAVFWVMGPVKGEMNGIQSDAARTINPELPYAANAAKQSQQIRELLNKQQESQKTRIAEMEKGEVPQSSIANRPPVVDESELNVQRANEMIQQQQKAQLEAAVGKTPETVAAERQQMIQKFLDRGILLLLLLGAAGLWGLFYFPAACAVAGYTRSFTATLNPTVGLDTIKRLGGDYVKILLMGLAIALMSGFISGVIAAALSAFDMPGVGNVPARAISSLFGFYFSVVFSCVIGFALYKASDRLKLFR